MLKKIEEQHQKELYIKMLATNDKKQPLPNFKEQMQQMDKHFCDRFPEVFQDKSRLTPLELTRFRPPTVKQDACIFRKHFVVTDDHQVVPNTKDQHGTVPRQFSSFTLPDLTGALTFNNSRRNKPPPKNDEQDKKAQDDGNGAGNKVEVNIVKAPGKKSTEEIVVVDGEIQQYFE